MLQTILMFLTCYFIIDYKEIYQLYVFFSVLYKTAALLSYSLVCNGHRNTFANLSTKTQILAKIFLLFKDKV